MRVALIGCGKWGSRLATKIKAHPSLDLVAIIDPDKRATRKFRRYRAAELTEKHNVEGVIIAIPPEADRITPMLGALDAGARTVLIEKPVALSVSEAEVIGSIGDAFEAEIFVGHTPTFNPALTTIRRVLALHTIHSGLFFRSSKAPLGSYGGPLFDLASHDLAIHATLFPQTWRDTIRIDRVIADPVDKCVAFSLNDGSMFTSGQGEHLTPVREQLFQCPEMGLRVDETTGIILANNREVGRLDPDPLFYELQQFSDRKGFSIRLAIKTTAVLQEVRRMLSAP
jgi:predicted dehydrogenase